MRRSKSITLTTLGAAAVAGGCAAEKPPAPAPAADLNVAPMNPIPASTPANTADFTWYDADGTEIEENWVFDDDANLVADPHPHDRKGRPWVRDENGELIPLDAAIPIGTTTSTTASGTTHSSTTTSQTTTYRRSPLIVPIFLGAMSMGRPAGPGMVSRPPTSTPARPPATSSGGFGGTGSGISGGS